MLSTKPTLAKALFHSPKTPRKHSTQRHGSTQPPLTPHSFELSRLKTENERLKAELAALRPASITISPDVFSVHRHSVQRVGLTRTLSQKSGLVVSASPSDRPCELVENMVTLFSHPRNSERYTTSDSFAIDLISLAKQAAIAFGKEPRLKYMSSPAYVFGDIHGNLSDLHFFSQHLWPFGMRVTAGKFVFLGDYVDRGVHSLEVVAYLFALKLACPEKVTCLRGNHELRRVNGWAAWYGAGSFIEQCKSRFGAELGTQVWEEVNLAFDNMPLAAVVDNSVFCTHGGIPRPVPVPPSLALKAPSAPMSAASTASWASSVEMTTPGSSGGPGYGRSPRTPRARTMSPAMSFSQPDLRLQAIAAAPVPLKLLSIPSRPMAPSPMPKMSGSAGNSSSDLSTGTPMSESSPETPGTTDMDPDCLVSKETATRVALDLMWADPASPEQEANGHLNSDGFGTGIRGGDTICFGTTAIDDFLKRNNFQVLVRAHQATAMGVDVSKSAKVVTVFSTSKDHGCGTGATCGCILIENGRLFPITRSETYNKPKAGSGVATATATATSSSSSTTGPPSKPVPVTATAPSTATSPSVTRATSSVPAAKHPQAGTGRSSIMESKGVFRATTSKASTSASSGSSGSPKGHRGSVQPPRVPHPLRQRSENVMPELTKARSDKTATAGTRTRRSTKSPRKGHHA